MPSSIYRRSADGTAIEIPLGGHRGGYVVIDAGDLAAVLGRTWYCDSVGYAHSDSAPRVRLHRLLMNPSDGLVVDHIDGNKLDCRRRNLRIVTQGQNTQNVRTKKGAMRGVYYDARRDRWYGQVKHNGKRHSTGYCKSPEEARIKVVTLRAAILTHG